MILRLKLIQNASNRRYLALGNRYHIDFRAVLHSHVQADKNTVKKSSEETLETAKDTINEAFVDNFVNYDRTKAERLETEQKIAKEYDHSEQHTSAIQKLVKTQIGNNVINAHNPADAKTTMPPIMPEVTYPRGPSAPSRFLEGRADYDPSKKYSKRKRLVWEEALRKSAVSKLRKPEIEDPEIDDPDDLDLKGKVSSSLDLLGAKEEVFLDQDLLKHQQSSRIHPLQPITEDPALSKPVTVEFLDDIRTKEDEIKPPEKYAAPIILNLDLGGDENNTRRETRKRRNPARQDGNNKIAGDSFPLEGMFDDLKIDLSESSDTADKWWETEEIKPSENTTRAAKADIRSEKYRTPIITDWDLGSDPKIIRGATPGKVERLVEKTKIKQNLI